MTRRLSRRALLTGSLGLTQMALLERCVRSVPSARASTNKHPKRLVTIYVPGGWMPSYLWCPLSAAQIDAVVPTPRKLSGETAYFRSDWVTNMDGSGDENAGAAIQKLRTAKMWDEASLINGNPDQGIDLGGGSPSNPKGWSWIEHALWENCSVVHGVDQGTAAHLSGRISAMCGAAGAEYRAPAIHSVVANALFDQYADTRPLPSVAIGQGPIPHIYDLPARVAPTVMSSVNSTAGMLGSLEATLSERSSNGWTGIQRELHEQVDFHGDPMAALSTTAIDEHALRQIRALRGGSSEGTDAFLQSIYDGYQNVSSVLAKDLVSKLESAQGIEHTPPPFWAGFGAGQYHFGTRQGGSSPDSGEGTWMPRFELALRLLKEDMCSAISLYCPGLGGFNFDTHGVTPGLHFAHVRAVWEVIGRFLGEMKATPGSDGGTLLDDTLVVIFSEFARTWPDAQDHWPITSVAFAGGGIEPNRMIGNYDVPPGGGQVGYEGTAVDLIDEGGDPISRPPRSADVIYTALKIMGIDDFFIPGGPGEIVGVAAAS